MRPDGSGRRPLVAGGRGGHFSTPAWSPDGRRLAFARLRAAGALLFTIRRDGAGLRRIGSGLGPAWSPDGSRIAFSDASRGVTAIFVAAADGSPRRRVTAPRRVFDSEPAWSPDGSRIAFVRAVETGGSIYVVDAAGSVSRLTRPRTDASPDWSPDGRHIAFVRDGRIWIMRSDGSGQRRISRTPPGWGRREWYDFAPAWSPDGRSIAFSSGHEEPGLRPRHTEIYVMRPDGAGRRRLTRSTSNQYEPSWRPVLG